MILVCDMTKRTVPQCRLIMKDTVLSQKSWHWNENLRSLFQQHQVAQAVSDDCEPKTQVFIGVATEICLLADDFYQTRL